MMMNKRNKNNNNNNKKSRRPKSGLDFSRTTTGLANATTFPNRSRYVHKSTVQAYTTIANNNRSFTFAVGWKPYIPYSNATAGTPNIPLAGDVAGGFTDVNAGVITTFDMSWYDTVKTIYQFYKPVRSRIKVTFTPGNGADSSYMAAAPYPTNLTIASYNQTSAIISAIPYSRNTFCTLYNNTTKNSVTITADAHTVLGMSRAQYMAMPPTFLDTNPNAVTNGAVNWMVCIYNASDIPYTSVCYLQIDYELECDWSEMVAPTL